MDALIGRAGELAALDGHLARAADGYGGLALVVGEAGIGKSALARAAAGAAAGRGFAVTFGRAWEFAEAPAYFPLWPCLQSIGARAEIDAPDAGTGDARTFRLWERAVDALARHASRQPVLWVVEDLHAADQQTLDFLCLLAQPLRGLPAAVVATARTRDARLTEPVEQRLARLGREALHLRLGPLDGTDVIRLLERHAARPLAAETAGTLIALTGGNPLFAVECARSLAASGAARLAGPPPTVRQLVLEQSRPLSRTTQARLSSGAVLGREFDAATVGRMHGVLPARIIDDLAPALRVGLLEELVPGRFAFTHALVRDAIYDQLGAEERLLEHGRAEAALRGAGDDPGLLVERAHHALHATVPGSEQQAIALASQAARLCETQGAWDRAFALRRRIVEVRRAAALPVDATLLLDLAELAQAAGLAAERRRLVDEALDAARAAGDAEALGRGALLRGVDLNPGVVDMSLVAVLREAAVLIPDLSSPLRCRLDARLAAALQPAADPQGPVAFARDVVARARRTGNDALIADVMFVAGSALADYAPLDERLAFDRELLERARRAGDAPRALRVWVRVLMDEAESGDFPAFERAADEMLVLAREVGHPRQKWRPLLLQSMRVLARGDFAESDRLVVEVERLAGVVDEPALRVSLTTHQALRARLLMRADDPAELIEAARAATAHVMGSRVVMGALWAALLVDRGRIDEARSALLPALAAWSAVSVDRYFAPLVGEVLVRVGTGEERRRALAVIEPWSDAEMHSGHIGYTYEGPMGRVAGLLRAVLGDPAGAARDLRRALDLARARGHLPWVARIAAGLAAVRRAAGALDEAAALVREARVLAESLGMSLLVSALAEDFADAPSQAAEARPTALPPAGAAALAVAREGELWAVSFEGRVVRVGDSRGMELLERLVARPGEELHVLALASDEEGSLVEADAGEVLDGRAVREYRARLRRIDEALAGQGAGIAGSRAKLREERKFIEQALAGGLGLQGKRRRAGSLTERARVNVQRRLRDAIRRLGEVDAALGAYLDRAIRTGTFCTFRP